MAEAKPPGLTDEEWNAITAHREANRPQRKGTLKGTDPESGAEFSIELTSDEAERLIGRHAGLFTDPPAGDGKGDTKPPAQLKDFFGKKQPPAKTG